MAGLVTEARAQIAGSEKIIVGALQLTKEQAGGEHTACPGCGGDDRFRLDLSRSKIRFFCNQCHPKGGDVIDLVMIVEGIADIKDGAKRACEIAGVPLGQKMTPEERKAAATRREERLKKAEADDRIRQAEAEKEAAIKREKAARAWKRRQPAQGTPAAAYWASRGLAGLPGSSIGFLPSYKGNPPAMVSAFAQVDESGSPMLDRVGGVHFTRLAADGSGKAGTDEDKTILGPGQSWPIVVAASDDSMALVIAEGIEDAASAHMATGWSAWAAGVANRMPGLAQHIPDQIRYVFIVEDDDDAGRRGTRDLAIALQAKGIDVKIERGGEKIPGSKGLKRADLNAELQKNGPAAVSNRLANSEPFTTNGPLDGGEPSSGKSKAKGENGDIENTCKGVSAMKDNSPKFPKGKKKSSLKTKPNLHVVDGGRDVTSDSDDGRPLIKIVANELHTMARDAEKHLIDAGVPFFVRSGMLVRPVREPQFDSQGKETHTSALIGVTSANMRESMSENIAWEKFNKAEKAWLSADPPKDLVEIMMDRRGNWAWLPIAGVISTPTLRPDGSILNKAGYDRSTRLYVAGTVDLPAMPEKPTKQDAQDALDMLEGLIAEFPFADKPSESVALSAIITVTVRGSMAVVPAHIARAHTAGTGKSYLFDIASAVANGTRCAIMTAGRDETETEKRLGAKALAGHPIINIDNVNGDLGGDNLCQLISQPSCDIRVLGTSNMPTIVNRSCIFATGNNIRLVGDMTRRSIIASLDSPLERPEERVFEGDPVGDVLRDRGTYIAACMTIVRAYIAAGRPKQNIKPMNGFEDWSQNVRAALVWLGKADPCETMALARDEDPQLQQLSQFLSALREDVGVGAQHAKTAGQFWKDASEMSFSDHTRPVKPVLAEALSQWVSGRKFNAVWFGRWLHAVKGRIVEGHRLSCIKDSHKKTMAWFVESVGGE